MSDSIALRVRHGRYRKERKVPRFTFIAVTEITPNLTQDCMFAKTNKISCQGCYVETLNPLPVGTSLDMVISRDEKSFTTKGRVIYVHKGTGMGIFFLDPDREQLQTLDHWLADRPRTTV
jgi:hypothetical protein